MAHTGGHEAPAKGRCRRSASGQTQPNMGDRPTHCEAYTGGNQDEGLCGVWAAANALPASGGPATGLLGKCWGACLNRIGKTCCTPKLRAVWTVGRLSGFLFMLGSAGTHFDMLVKIPLDQQKSASHRSRSHGLFNIGVGRCTSKMYFMLHSPVIGVPSQTQA